MRHCLTLLIRIAAFAAIVLVSTFAAGSDGDLRPGLLTVRPGDAASTSGFEHFYNMEYAAAVRDFESALDAHPADPFAVNHLLLAIIFQELHRAKVLDPDLYVSDKFLGGKKISLEPSVRERIKTLTQRAFDISDERIDSNSNDIDALYARGVTHSLQAAYLGVIEKSWFAALRSSLAAYKDHKRVLTLSPAYNDAKLVVGMYNYIVGSLPWHIKAAAFLVAITGSKPDGIQYLYQAANGGGEASIDAKTFLSVFLSRERKYSDSISLVHTLCLAYPRNFLFALGEANLLRKSGQLPQAAAAYRKLMASAHDGVFQDPPLELAAFGLAETLRTQGDYENAAVFYNSVSGYSRVDEQLAAEARKSAAEMNRLFRQKSQAPSNGRNSHS